MPAIDNNVAALRADEQSGSSDLESLASLAPKPRSLADTGLSTGFVTELIAKHLQSGGVLTLATLVDRIALTGPILEKMLSLQ